MTSELVPWRGHTVPVLSQQEISRYDISAYLRMITQGGYGLHAPIPVQTTYGRQAQEPIANNFQGFVEGLLYSNGPVAAITAYRLRVFSQAPMLFRRKDGTRPGDYYDDPSLDQLRRPWPGGSLGDLMKLALIHSDFAGNAYIVRIEDELVCLRPDWVKIVLERRMYGGVQVGWRQMGIAYVENGNYADVDFNSPEIATFLPGEYAHFKSAFPDPLANYRGMSWLTPIVNEVMSDKAATQHKLKYFENSATPNLAVKTPAQLTPTQFRDFVALMREQSDGVQNAGRTLYLGDGADVTVIGSNMQQMDFAAIQGKIETRIANGGGIHAVLIGFSEGMQGSSLNAGNYGAAKRNTTDTTIRDLWRNWCSSMQELFPPPDPADELSYDERDIPYLHEDQQDEAGVRQTDAATISSLITSGFEPDSVVAAVSGNDWSLLKHTGLTSVQLLPPGAQDTDGDGSVDVTAEDGESEDAYLAALEEFRSQLEAWDWEDVIIRTVVDGEDEDEIDRARYNIRRPEGVEGGGRFRKLSEVVFQALDDWMNGEGPDDPLTDVFTKDQLRLAAKQLGLVRDRERVSEGVLKKRLLDKATADVREQRDAPDGGKDAPEPRKAETPKAERLFTAADREQAERILSRLTQSEFEQDVADPSRSRKELADASRLLGLPTSGTKDALRKRLVERAAELRKGGVEKPDAPKAADRRVLDTLADAPKGRYVKLADFREQLGDVDRQELDQALLRLARDGRIILTPEEDRRRIKKRESDAAIRFADQEQHFVTLADSEAPDTGRRTLSPRQRDLLAKAAASDVIDVDKSDPDVQALVAAGYIDLDPRSNRAEITGRGALKAKLLRLDAPESPAVAKVQAAKKVTPQFIGDVVREIKLYAADSGPQMRFEQELQGRGAPPTPPAEVADHIDEWVNGPDGPLAGARAVAAGERWPTAQFSPEFDSAEVQAREVAILKQQAANWTEIARRLRGQRPRRISEDPRTTIDAESRPPAKKAAPRKATPRVPKEPPADVAAKLQAATSRDEAKELLKGKTAAELKDIAAAAGVAVPAKSTKARLEADIVQHTVGRRVPSDAVAGRPGEPGVVTPDPVADFHARAGFTERQKQIDTDIRAAFERLKGRTDLPEGAMSNAGISIHTGMRKGGYVAIADLRDELGEKYNRHELDEVLKAIAVRDQSAYVIPEVYQWGLLQRDRDSALSIGGEPNHWIKLEGASATRSSNLDEEDLIRSEDDEGPDDDLDEAAAEAEEFEADLDEDEAERAVYPDDDSILRAMDPDGEEFRKYWTRGKGLRKWLGRPREWTSLKNHLRKYVGEERAKRIATTWFHLVKGFYPGSDLHRVEKGKPPRGNRIGPG